ncbi:MAG: hypothetical protein WAX57_02285 [Minisyncoccia bacterium]
MHISIRQQISAQTAILGFFVAVLGVIPGVSYAQNSNLPAPTISSIVRSIESSGGIDVRGNASPSTTINIELISDQNGPLVREQVRSNEAGEWNVSLNGASFRDGAYTLRAIVQDEKGLLGAATEVRGYKVEPKALLSVNGIQFGWFDAFLGLAFLMFLLAAFGSWYYEHRRRLHEEHVFMTERDIQRASDNLLDEVQRLDHLIRESKGMDPQITAEAEYLLKSHQTKLEKMRGYLSVGIRKTV